MNLLLDTCAFLWLSLTPEKVSKRALAEFKSLENYTFLSAASAWEIAVKYGRGSLSLTSAPRIFIPQMCAIQNIKIIPLELEAAVKASDLPSIHKDPFDRILICQALVNNFTIITPDPEIQAYPVKTIW